MFFSSNSKQIDFHPAFDTSIVETTAAAGSQKAVYFPSPPAECFAVPRNGSAVVWWIQEPNNQITDWEVHRQRQDLSGEWRDKEIFHYNIITVERMHEIMAELGEAVKRARLTELFLNYGGKTTICKWDHFILVCEILKRVRFPSLNLSISRSQVQGSWSISSLVRSVVTVCHGRAVTYPCPWTSKWDPLAQRNYYFHSGNQERRWDAPEEFRLLLPAVVEEKLLQRLDDFQIDRLKLIFLSADKAFLGSLDEIHFGIALHALSLKLMGTHTQRKRGFWRTLPDASTIKFAEESQLLHDIIDNSSIPSPASVTPPAEADADDSLPVENQKRERGVGGGKQGESRGLSVIKGVLKSKVRPGDHSCRCFCGCRSPTLNL